MTWSVMVFPKNEMKMNAFMKNKPTMNTGRKPYRGAAQPLMNAPMIEPPV
jgi:hypothetical protein